MPPIELTNFTVWGRDWFADGWEGLRAFCGAQGIAGVELLGAGITSEVPPPADLVHGVHLHSLGSWLPLAGVPVRHFGDASGRYQGVATYRDLVQARVQELREVAKLEPQYVVWHGSYAPQGYASADGETLTAEQVLSPLASLVRDVLHEFAPPYDICFENAYGVGVGPDALGATAGFLAGLAGLPVGIVLDIGHYLNCYRDLATPEAACRELLRVGGKFRAAGIPTDVLHLHWTPPELVPRETAAPAEAGCYFQQCDQHHPLAHPMLAEAVEAVAPKYVVHEMGAMSLVDHATWLTAQATAMRGAPQ